MSGYILKKKSVAVCACTLLMGGASTALLAQAAAATEPVPGTRDYYEQKIKGAYVFYEGELLPIPAEGTADVSRPLSPGIMRRPRATWMECRILQVLSNDFVVIGQTVTHTSGATTWPRSGVVAFNRPRSVKEGILVRLLAISDGSYQYTTASTNGTLCGYRELAEPTYEEYQKNYERDLQASLPIPIVSLERNVRNRTVPAGLPWLQSTRSSSQARVLPPAPLRPSLPTAPLYTTTNNVVTLVRYPAATGDVIVTNEVNGLPVTTIGPEAFKNCTALTHVTIPASVTHIDESAFRDCPALEAILVNVLNPVYSSSADGVLFNAEKTRLIQYPQGRKGAYTIPSRVTDIGSWAFLNCTNLTNITIPNNVKTIGGGAFYKCSSLTRMEIPARVTRLEGNSFSYCSRMEKIIVDDANAVYRSDADGVVFNKDKTELIRYPGGRRGDYVIPSGTLRVGFTSFEGSFGLTGVIIPRCVTSIDQWAFPGCDNLATVTLPDTITYIGHCTFWHCDNLTRVYFEGDAPKTHDQWWYTFGDTQATLYYKPERAGWGKEFAGRPTAVWKE